MSVGSAKEPPIASISSEQDTQGGAVRAIVPIVARVIIAVVFAWAAVPKLLDPATFAADLENYRVLPETLVGHVALFVPSLELIVAAALLWPRYQRGASLIATGLLLMFSAAMAQARMRGIDLSCGCFGAAFESKVSWWTVGRSAVLSAIAILPLVWSKGAPASARR
jgi:putative oxidoreductase